MNKMLVEQIYESIHEDIVSLALKPGQKLHLLELANHYKVGPGPVREALSRLLATDLVVAFSQKGFRVAPISEEDLEDVYKTRAHIEVVALKLAMLKGGDDWEADIIATHHRLAKFEAEHRIDNPSDYQEWEMRHRAFNQALLSACDLKHLLRMQQQIYILTERYRRQWLLAGKKQHSILPYAKNQKKILDAVLTRNVELASELLAAHYQNAAKTVRTYFLKSQLFDSSIIEL